MFSRRTKRGLGIAVFGLVPLAVPMLASGVAQGHGWVQSPPSRQDACATGAVKDCGAIQYEPQSVEGPKGFPQAGPADGHICSAGHEPFQALDDPSKQWPATKVQAGQDFQFTWKITAAHSTTSFRYFVTKDGYDPSKPLTRDQLEPAPFLQDDLGGKQPPSTYTTSGKLPAGKSGRHLVLGVWDIADTGNAFYACSDVDFG
ncbi:lytic polysaccharide monooxygenase auxiliary activity family 9 protein [Saccharopolyspora rosea]|uniref:lytic polysaccharide monooxygenase auxiliary activity family 9 protein n=1 Tax=Saccharopolyspora rosea TaxID=524884 RepID=UPI0021DA74BC|nr:lytic polysaccharide monooxygenase auxiliary activity family 9 protein [Saccharopolyspora rosea]